MPTEEQLLKFDILSASIVSLSAAIVAIATFLLLRVQPKELGEGNEKTDKNLIAKKKRDNHTKGSKDVQGNNTKGTKETLENNIYESQKISRILIFAALLGLIGEAIGAITAYIRLEIEAQETDEEIRPSLKAALGSVLSALGSVLLYQAAVESPEDVEEGVIPF
jgi:hypothetical protein